MNENYIVTLTPTGYMYWGKLPGKNNIYFDFRMNIVGIQKSRSMLSFFSKEEITWLPMEKAKIPGEYVYDYIEDNEVITDSYLSPEQLSFQINSIKEGEAKFLIIKPRIETRRSEWKYYNGQLDKIIPIEHARPT
jgi:hypothetical protein